MLLSFKAWGGNEFDWERETPECFSIKSWLNYIILSYFVPRLQGENCNNAAKHNVTFLRQHHVIFGCPSNCILYNKAQIRAFDTCFSFYSHTQHIFLSTVKQHLSCWLFDRLFLSFTPLLHNFTVLKRQIAATHHVV